MCSLGLTATCMGLSVSGLGVWESVTQDFAAAHAMLLQVQCAKAMAMAISKRASKSNYLAPLACQDAGGYASNYKAWAYLRCWLTARVCPSCAPSARVSGRAVLPATPPCSVWDVTRCVFVCARSMYFVRLGVCVLRLRWGGR